MIKASIPGIITTDAIYGATPAAFYAHRRERNNTHGILEDLGQSELDFFIAGGWSKVSMIRQNFKTLKLEQFNELKQPVAIYWDNNTLPADQGQRIQFV